MNNNFLNELTKFADYLDYRGLHKEADELDRILASAKPRFRIRKGDGFDYVQDWSSVSQIKGEDRPLESAAMVPNEASSLAMKLNEADKEGKRILHFRVA